MASKVATYLLLILLVVFQGQLWLGRGSVFHVWQMEQKLAGQEQQNQAAKRKNEQLLIDIRDLKEGLVLIEDRARFELGMVKPNEVFVQYAK